MNLPDNRTEVRRRGSGQTKLIIFFFNMGVFKGDVKSKMFFSLHIQYTMDVEDGPLYHHILIYKISKVFLQSSI